MLTQVALALAIGATAVSAQSSTIPLAAKRFDYNNLVRSPCPLLSLGRRARANSRCFFFLQPYQADTGDGERGRQSGVSTLVLGVSCPTRLGRRRSVVVERVSRVPAV